MKTSWRLSVFGSALLLLLTVAAFLPALHGGFIWDDDQHLLWNSAVTSPGGLRSIWTSLVLPVYYPVTFTTFWGMYQIWGPNAVPYHVVTLLLHAANAALLFLVLQQLKIRAAWLIAAVWAVHPVNTESVAWITELKNTLSGAFFFLTLLSYFRFERDSKPSWYVVTLVCFAAALLSKSSTVVLPVVLLLCCWWQRGQLTRADVLRSVPFFFLTFAVSVVAIIAQMKEKAEQGQVRGWALTWPERLIIAGKDFWFYEGKLLWPQGLTFIYPRWTHNAHSFTEWVPLTGAVLLVLVLWRWRQMGWGRAALFGIGYFVVALSPVLGFFDQFFYRYSFVADHFQYLASPGVIALVIVGAAEVLKARSEQLTAALICLVVLGGLSWKRSEIFRERETLWRDTIAKNPDAWMAHHNLGGLLAERGQGEEAIAEYMAALRVNPNLPETHYNLGETLFSKGAIEPSVVEFQEALRLDPSLPKAHHKLGLALASQGRMSEAVEEYAAELRLDPTQVVVHLDLGNALARLGRWGEAEAAFRSTLMLDPSRVQARHSLGDMLARQGRSTEAIHEYEVTLQLNPHLAETHHNLALALASQGQNAAAITHFRDALAIDPKLAATHGNLGLTLTRVGQRSDAIVELELALRLDPNYPEAHFDLAEVLVAEGRSTEAIPHYREAVRLAPDWPEPLGKLAWHTATSANDGVRNGAAAMRLAEKFSQLTGELAPGALDVLAAAYAEAGQFDRAVATAQRAATIAQDIGQDEMARQIRERLRLYRAGRPYRQ